MKQDVWTLYLTQDFNYKSIYGSERKENAENINYILYPVQFLYQRILSRHVTIDLAVI